MGHRIHTFATLAGMLALAVVPLSAQNLGLHLGASIAKLGGKDVTGANSRTGLNIGATYTLPFTDVLGIQLGGAYAQKGAKQSESGVDLTLAMDYIEIPVLLRVGIPHSGPVGAHLVAGPALGLNVSCKAKGTSQGVSASVDCSTFGADVKTFDIGAMGGVGIDFAASPGLDISVDVLYNLGLASVSKTSGTDVKNRAFTIQAGVGLPMG